MIADRDSRNYFDNELTHNRSREIYQRFLYRDATGHDFPSVNGLGPTAQGMFKRNSWHKPNYPYGDALSDYERYMKNRRNNLH